ncbi:MAG: CRISPR-associated protein Cas4 [Oscillospiraceae bacterium]
MLSGIQHFAFCRRQWALIHIEQVWAENSRTAEGQILHENCHDSASSERRGDLLISRGMPVFSRTLGVSGECDAVEFHKNSAGIMLAGKDGLYTVFPTEYKHGEPKEHDADALQLTAQAMCLEEMLVCEIPVGALFYGKTRRRQRVELTPELRARVRDICAEMHTLIARGYVPRVKPTKSCNACSLKEFCMPKLYKRKNAGDYLRANFSGMEEEPF